ncbi:30S ribosomal protein S17, chloroplastic (Fragment) [Linum grandiflorum]
MKILEGVVVKTSRDKTVAVEVTRQVQHPKYHRRVRIKKLLHAHDPENKFQIGDLVQLDRTRPISKTKSFLAIPAPPRVSNKDKKSTNEDLGIPLQSQLS